MRSEDCPSTGAMTATMSPAIVVDTDNAMEVSFSVPNADPVM